MTPNSTQLSAVAHAVVDIVRHNEAVNRLRIVEESIAQWEKVRPPDPAVEELAQAKRDIAELNERLHERTQSFLTQITGLNQELASFRREPNIKPDENIWVRCAAWMQSEGYQNHPSHIKSYMREAWGAAYNTSP